MKKHIPIKSNICQICGEKTHWDSSYGRDAFIVCPDCYKKLNSKFKSSVIYDFIFTISRIREEKMEEDLL